MTPLAAANHAFQCAAVLSIIHKVSDVHDEFCIRICGKGVVYGFSPYAVGLIPADRGLTVAEYEEFELARFPLGC